MTTEYTALEIRCPKIAEIATALDPTLKELDYEKDLHLKFLVFNFPKEGTYAVVSPETFDEHFDHIENGLRITLKQFIKK